MKWKYNPDYPSELRGHLQMLRREEMKDQIETDIAKELVQRENDMRKALLEYRKKHFKVKVKPSTHSQEEGEICLSITCNGYQWTTISLLKSEVEKVVMALTK